jgi:hypothetical protein
MTDLPVSRFSLFLIHQESLTKNEKRIAKNQTLVAGSITNCRRLASRDTVAPVDEVL